MGSRMNRRNKPDIGVYFLFATLVGICVCAAMLAWGCFLPGCSAANSQAGHDALTESVNGVLVKLNLLDDRLSAQAGRDVNTGLSSRAIAFILIFGVPLAILAYRWDRNRSNRIITEKAIRKAANGDGPHDDGYRSNR